MYSNWSQERETALAEGKPAPALSGSADIRPLNMDDFKYAHERVRYRTYNTCLFEFARESTIFKIELFCLVLGSSRQKLSFFSIS